MLQTEAIHGQSDIDNWKMAIEKRLDPEAEFDHYLLKNKYVCPYSENDVCTRLGSGFDPQLFFEDGKYVLVLRQAVDEQYHPGITVFGYKMASTIEGLKDAETVFLQGKTPRTRFFEAWALELHVVDGLVVALVTFSNGYNPTHRAHVMVSEGFEKPFNDLGPVRGVEDLWGIDMTMFPIPYNGNTEYYAALSAWLEGRPGFPQVLKMGKFIDFNTINNPTVIAEPKFGWCVTREKNEDGSEAKRDLVEGPQPLYIDNQFVGLTYAAAGSWCQDYCTGIVWYLGGDPEDQHSWYMDEEPLFPPGFGIGHGMQINKSDLFAAHRILKKGGGWDDRDIFVVRLNLDALRQRYLEIRQRVSSFSQKPDPLVEYVH